MKELCVWNKKGQFWGLDIGNAEINSTVIYEIIFHILIIILHNAHIIFLIHLIVALYTDWLSEFHRTVHEFILEVI